MPSKIQPTKLLSYHPTNPPFNNGLSSHPMNGLASNPPSKTSSKPNILSLKTCSGKTPPNGINISSSLSPFSNASTNTTGFINLGRFFPFTHNPLPHSSFHSSYSLFPYSFSNYVESPSLGTTYALTSGIYFFMLAVLTSSKCAATITP